MFNLFEDQMSGTYVYHAETERHAPESEAKHFINQTQAPSEIYKIVLIYICLLLP